MCDWKWESFEAIINDASFSVIDAGPLLSPIRSFSINRNDKLDVTLETNAAPDSTSNTVVHPAGTVRINNDSVTFSASEGVAVVAHGVQPLARLTTIRVEEPLGEVSENSSIRILEGVINPGATPAYVIDWVANLHDHFVWPHTTEDRTETIRTRSFRHDVNGVTLRSAHTRPEGGSRNCVKLSVDGCDIFLCTSKAASAKNITKPGYILYLGNPPDEFRRKIRDCLSFALGSYLVYLGRSSFDETWRLHSFAAISGYSLGGRAFELPATPPAPLGMKYEWEIDPAIFTRMITSLFSAYETLNLGSQTWAYWHAVGATPHIAAVHFGAAIEALQSSYLKAHPECSVQSILKSEDFATVRKALDSAVSGLTIDEETRTLLINKLGTLNVPPHNIKSDRLLQALQLTLSATEKNAWKRRNDAGHGNHIDYAGYRELVIDLKILRQRFNRLLLAMTGGSALYYDYVSIGRPTRVLRDPIP